jgi:hypothetical protein
MTRRRALAHPVPTGETNLPIELHRENAPALPAAGKGPKWPSFTPPAASLPRRYRGRLLHRRSHLFDLIDEETDPGDYEYTVLRHDYGIEFRKGEWTVHYKIGKGAKALSAALSKADGVYMTEALLDALVSGKGLKWRRLYED